MRNIFLTLAVLLLSFTQLQAQKSPPCQNDGPARANCAPSSPLAAGPEGTTSSPIEPRDATDARFVENSGAGLDSPFPLFERANHATLSNSNLGAPILEAIKPLQPQRF